MESLDKETFSFWVTHPDELLPADFQQLREALDQYPYCQALYTLGAKAAAVHQRSHAIEWTRQAAAHALSRNALRKLIESEFQWSENLLSRLNELSLKHVPIPDDYQKESYALFKSRQEKNRSFASFSLLDLVKPDFRTPPADLPEAGSQEAAAPVPEAIPLVDDSTITENTLQSELEQTVAPEQQVAPVVPPADPVRQQQMEIIENFIRNEPRISPVRLKPGQEPEPVDLSEKQPKSMGGIATESMAKILVMQGKLDKAIDVYQKLMVKNPEKKVYFADKIEELKARRGQ